MRDDQRSKHVYILGKQGTGKSTLMLSMIRQDILNGKGVGVIDPHGDLAEQALRYIPKERIEDTVYFNPLVTPIGIDFFSAKTEAEKLLIAGDMFLVFQRLTGEGGAKVRMDAVLKRAIQLLIEIPGSTFLDLYRMFTDPYFLHQLVESVTDQGLRDYWKNVWPRYPHPITEEPLVTRLSEFDSNKLLRKIVSTTSSLNFSDVIAKKKIFIANIAKGGIGVDTSPILGTLLVSQFQLAGFRQSALPASQRVPCYLFVDEFQNFKTSAFNEIIIEARKYKLCLTLANQTIEDLAAAGLQSTIDKCETAIFFRLIAEDARRFGKALAFGMTHESLLNLDNYTAIIRPGRPYLSKIFKVKKPPPLPAGYRNEIIEHVKKTYPSLPSTKRLQVTAGKAKDEAIEPGLSPE